MLVVGALVVFGQVFEVNETEDVYKRQVFMISELAKLLRISLSKGRTIIKISDEIQHSRSYMNIQMARYKERFKIRFEIDDEINDYCIVKLVIQPLLENAISVSYTHLHNNSCHY